MRRGPKEGLLPLLVCVASLLGPGRALAWQPGVDPAIRGITIGPIESSQQPGRGYGTSHSEELLDELVRLGANTVSLTPFGRIWSLDSTEIMLDFEAPYPDNREAVGRMVEQAHARGLAVVLIPHLWVETEGWRGEIDPGSPEAWAEFQESYRHFIGTWARDAARWGVEGFSIGVECKSWSGRFGGYWTALIREIRSVYKGSLTYSSNWDEADNVLFWDQLDWVGINAFYPLAQDPTDEYGPYVDGANRAVDSAVQLGQTLQMPVVLLEIGYTSRKDSAIEPWLWPDDMTDVSVDEWEQARAISALVGAAVSREDLIGFFVWRYYASLDDVSQEAIWGFSPHGKLAEQVLDAAFAAPWAADPSVPPWQPAPRAPREHPAYAPFL